VTPAFLSVAQAAQALGISKAQAYKLVRDRKIPSTRWGNKIVVPACWVDDEAARVIEAWRAQQDTAA
jgi:excisionase family DNA binding protein